jgi:hypothetical protein
MRKSIGVIAAVALTIAAVAAWSNASIRADAALHTFGPAVTDAQIDVLELTKTARGLSFQEVAAF